MTYFSIFGFYDLDLVKNDTNLITLSHLHQKLSRLANNGKNSVFWPPSCTYDVMTYVTWQRQDDVTYAKMCLPSRVSDTMRRFSPLESSKKLQGKNARGGGTPPPLGVRGLSFFPLPMAIRDIRLRMDPGNLGNPGNFCRQISILIHASIKLHFSLSLVISLTKQKQNKTTISVHDEFLSDSTFDYSIMLLFHVRFSNNVIFLFYRSAITLMFVLGHTRGIGSVEESDVYKINNDTELMSEWNGYSTGIILYNTNIVRNIRRHVEIQPPLKRLPYSSVSYP